MKSDILTRIRAELRARLDRLSKAAFEAHAAATDPGSKAEGKYDTRSLEASYLAAGQARQVDELAESVRVFETLSLPDFAIDDEIDAGALVEVELNGETQFFLLVPTSGGLVIVHDHQPAGRRDEQEKCAVTIQRDFHQRAGVDGVVHFKIG